MTIPKDEQNRNEELALRLMLQELPEDRSYDCVWFDGDKEPFLTVYSTTWKGLTRSDLVKEWTFNRYQLTGLGWIFALRLSEEFDSQEFKKKAGKLRAALRAALKKCLDDRKADNLVSMVHLQKETGLPESFIHNAIDSHLLYHIFSIQDAQWADDKMKGHIEVPLDFGVPVDQSSP